MGTRTRLLAAVTVLTFGIGACTVDAEGEDPADMESVDQGIPGDQDGSADDAQEFVETETGDEPANGDADDDADRPDDTDVEAPEGASLATTTTDRGEYLVDAQGWAVYASVADADGVSSCVGECLDDWPILSIRGEPDIGEGVDDELVGTIARQDGTPQLTYAGYPVHHYASDPEPGEVHGHGVDDEWSLISPDGELLLEQDGDEG